MECLTEMKTMSHIYCLSYLSYANAFLPLKSYSLIKTATLHKQAKDPESVFCIYTYSLMEEGILPCMCELCWAERRHPVEGDDPWALNCQPHHLEHCGHSWTGLYDAD